MVRQNLERLRVRASKGQDVTLTVLEAANARSALSLMSTVAPDLVVLDLLLPELSGYEVCERLRANAAFERVPVLAISARAMPQERAAAEEAGASAFLAKPFTKQQLAEQVLPLLEDNDREK
jgi:two-component system chemotaxis response regulator CheY